MECPKCHSENIESEAPNKPWFLMCTCECEFEFSYDTYRDEYSTIEGNVL